MVIHELTIVVDPGERSRKQSVREAADVNTFVTRTFPVPFERRMGAEYGRM
jgi:hypothetical protein